MKTAMLGKYADSNSAVAAKRFLPAGAGSGGMVTSIPRSVCRSDPDEHHLVVAPVSIWWISTLSACYIIPGPWFLRHATEGRRIERKRRKHLASQLILPF